MKCFVCVPVCLGWGGTSDVNFLLFLPHFTFPETITFKDTMCKYNCCANLLFIVPPAIDLLDVPTVLNTKGTSTNNPGSTSSPKTSKGSRGPEVSYKHSSRRRRKRQVSLSSTKIEPELLLFCDNAMVQQFEGDTDELLEYLLHFWHAVSWSRSHCLLPLEIVWLIWPRNIN